MASLKAETNEHDTNEHHSSKTQEKGALLYDSLDKTGYSRLQKFVTFDGRYIKQEPGVEIAPLDKDELFLLQYILREADQLRHKPAST